MNRKLLIAPSLFLMLFLYAEEDLCYIEEPCCMEDECCPIEYECYMPSYSIDLCGTGRFLQIDYLYWYAKDIDLAYAVDVEVIPYTQGDPGARTFTQPKKYDHLKAKWSSGFRVGIGRYLGCEEWDTSINWTYYWNKKKSSSSVPTFGNTETFGTIGAFFPGPFQKALVNPWTNDSQLGFPALFNTIEATIHIKMHQLDLEMGKKYWLSDNFTLHWSGGLRGLWVQTRFNTDSSGTYTNQTEVNASDFQDQFTNKTMAAGLLVGMNPNFQFGTCFALFGFLKTSLLFGKFDERKREDYLFIQTPNQQEPAPLLDYNQTYKTTEYRMQAGIDLQAGLRWETAWCCNRIHTAIEFGWENKIWFDLNGRKKFHSAISSNNEFFGYESYDQIVSDLVLGGLVIRGQINF